MTTQKNEIRPEDRSITEAKKRMLEKAAHLFFLVSAARGTPYSNDTEIRKNVESFSREYEKSTQAILSNELELFKQALIKGNNHANNADIYRNKTPLEKILNENKELNGIFQEELLALERERYRLHQVIDREVRNDTKRFVYSSALALGIGCFIGAFFFFPLVIPAIVCALIIVTNDFDLIVPRTMNLSADSPLLHQEVISDLLDHNQLHLTSELQKALSNSIKKRSSTTTNIFKGLNVDVEQVEQNLKESREEEAKKFERIMGANKPTPTPMPTVTSTVESSEKAPENKPIIGEPKSPEPRRKGGN